MILMKIHIFGSSGSGTTSLGRELGKILKSKHLDTDDFYWKKTDPPFIEKNPVKLRTELILEEIKGLDSWILSGSMDSWCGAFIDEFELAIYLEASSEIREKRLRARELKNFSSRILEGGDMFEEHEIFIEWALQYEDGAQGGRSRARHEEFIKNLKCNTIRITNEGSAEEMIEQALRAIRS
ncbi:MAG: adenylate kinase family enzyme [Bacteriovoracaceae bacterium]|jgi:adenylate kinase family enzyme